MRVGYLSFDDELSAQVEATLWDAIRPRPKHDDDGGRR
jgi:hypothetical protein